MEALQGVVMELDDCAFPLLAGIEPTATLKTAFDGTSWALLVGSIPRKAGMERNDLLTINGGIFGPQGEAIAAHAASTSGCWWSATPCNTNCLIARAHAPEIPDDRWFAMTRLDQNRAQSLLARKAGVPVTAVTNVGHLGQPLLHAVPRLRERRASTASPPPRSSATSAGSRVTSSPPSSSAAPQIIEARGASLGRVGRQRRGRLRAQHRAPDRRRRLRVAGGRLPWRLRRPRGPHLRASRSGPTAPPSPWWKDSSTATSPATASA